MPVLPNIHFSLLVKLDGRLREINFRKRTELLYNADLSDERGTRHHFDWRYEDGAWDLHPVSVNFPAWLSNNAPAIREKFLEHFL